MQQNLSPRQAETAQPAATAYKASKTPFGPFHDPPRETRKKKGDVKSKRARVANMRASINQQKAGRRGKGRISPSAQASTGGGPKTKRGGKRGKRNSMPTAGPRGIFPDGRPTVERLPHIDPGAPSSVLRHSGREETMGEYSASVTARENFETAAQQGKWSYLDSDESHVEPVKQPRALRRVAPKRGRTPPEFSRRETTGRPVRGGSAGSARGNHPSESPLDHRGRFVSR